MRARFIIYRTGGGPDPPPPPPDPSIAEAEARRESVAIIQASNRRRSRYGQASLQLDRTSARPSTTEPTGGPKGIIEGREPTPDTETGFFQGAKDIVDPPLTDAQVATNNARTLDYEVQRLMARRNARIGVSASLGNS